MKISFAVIGLFLSALLLPAADAVNVTLIAGKSFVIDTPADVERVAVSTEDTVEAVAVTQREVVLNGKAPGETTVLIWQRNTSGRLAYDVTVEPSNLKEEALRRRLHKEVSDTVDGELDDKTVFLRGSVKTQAEGEKALAIASAWGKPVNLLMVATPPAKAQILLKVKFADVDRSASLQLGMNILSTGAAKTVGSLSTQQFSPPSPGAVSQTTPETFTLSNALNLFLFDPKLNLGATIEALEGKNLVQILAEPNVLARDGVAASFLAGGEFPFPVVQSSTNGTNNVTIQFREFGVRLTFTPTITPRGTISLEVSPEVSSLDYANGLTYNGFNIPGLDVRRIKTEVELQNNQSFAIAGLLDNRVTENLSKIPGLGDIPLFGKLFQSRNIAKTNSELMIVVTPELVEPTAAQTVPGIEMPKPFLKDGATALPPGNTPDARPLPVLQLVPFVPAEKKPEIQPAAQDLAGALPGSFKATK